jgi:ribosomal protein S17
MYALDDMIEIGMEKGKKWKSKAHKDVAIAVCIYNPNVHTAICLGDNVRIINKIPMSKIKKVTVADLVKLGCEITD